MVYDARRGNCTGIRIYEGQVDISKKVYKIDRRRRILYCILRDFEGQIITCDGVVVRYQRKMKKNTRIVRVPYAIDRKTGLSIRFLPKWSPPKKLLDYIEIEGSRILEQYAGRMSSG